MCAIDKLVGNFCCFFFQAEDGIRYLVRSRGLGDVYKRQMQSSSSNAVIRRELNLSFRGLKRSSGVGMLTMGSVSYTHLTLPTSDLV